MSVLISLCSFFALSSVASADPTVFTQNSATTLSKGDWSIGVFSPLRYGLTDTIELSVVHPGWVLTTPHLRLMSQYEKLGDWSVASRHQLGYPTPLLKQLARKGTGGVLPPDSTIPHTLVSKNDVYFGKTVNESEMTLSVGFALAVELGDSDYPTIDYAYGFRQTNLYQNKTALQLGFGWEQFITEKIGFRTWSKGYYFPLADEAWALEQRDTVLFQVSETSQASVGVNLSVAEYPWGEQWHAFPALDWMWIW